MTTRSAKPTRCLLPLLACTLAALPAMAQQVTTVDSMTTASAAVALSSRNDSTSNTTALVFGSFSPPSLLPSAVLEQLQAVMSGYLSQGSMGLIAFAVVLLVVLLCLRRLVSFIQHRDWHRAVYSLLRSKDDGLYVDSKSSPRTDGPRPSPHRVKPTTLVTAPRDCAALLRLTAHVTRCPLLLLLLWYLLYTQNGTRRRMKKTKGGGAATNVRLSTGNEDQITVRNAYNTSRYPLPSLVFHTTLTCPCAAM